MVCFTAAGYIIVNAPSNIDSPPCLQEQDRMGGDFDADQSFVGMMSDVHMWNYVLSPCEIQRFMDDVNFSPGNVLNWRALDFETVGKVVLEGNQKGCH